MATTYNIYQDDVKVSTGITAPPKVITGLTSGTAYKFEVTEDIDGVESPKSVALNVTTTVAVTGVTMSPKNATGTTGTAGTKQFTGTVAPANATDKTVKYTITPATAGYSINASTGKLDWTDVAVPAVITVTATTTDGAKTDTGTLTTTAP